ncbi:MAG TPA: peptidylprolyl isomerase [Terriglobia bacterium]|nr:peptidylprolyl isomerase [Terriglobia bacterium]
MILNRAIPLCLGLFVFFQLPLQRTMLEEEDGRVENPVVLLEALKNPDPQIQRIAARAIGRFERADYAGEIRPLLASTDPAVRREAVNALGQMNASFDFRSLLDSEKDATVRGEIYETIGRLPEVAAGTEDVLTRGLVDPDLPARTGAVKGIEALFRLNSRSMKPDAETITALRDVIRNNTSSTVRELALLTLNAAGDADAATLALALADAEPQVRRLAVAASKQWKDDPSPIVRYEALRVAGNCDRAAATLRDPSEHVVLLAIDQLGNACSPKILERIVDTDKDWRHQARALVSLAKVDRELARKRLPKFADHSMWQVRAYAGAAAKIVKDERTLTRLSRDSNPNVIAASFTSPRDAIKGLDSPDYGLVRAAAENLKGWEDGRLAMSALLGALDRITREKKATSRDPRKEILERLREFGNIRAAGELRPLLSDPDPVIAQLAADINAQLTGVPEVPRTKRYAPPPLPPDSYFRGLAGATVLIKLKEAGPLTVQMFLEDAPVTVAMFAGLAEKGYYNGLTIHRIVPNFVVQGGSPGANEYVGIPDFMRDELGLQSNLRGTLGLSTRGRDTGDGQFYINLIDNFRLDHNYTVFARITEGLENLDKIQEGDVIESIEIRRKLQP